MNVFIEDPSYFLAVQMFKDYGLNMVSVATDPEGMSMASLEAEVKIAEEEAKLSKRKSAGGGPLTQLYDGLVFIVPTFGNPTGATLPDARRRRLVTLARRHNLLVLSDDVYQLLPFPGVTPPPRLVSCDLQMGAGSGGKCHVLSNGSFSKLMGPGVRLGWLEGGTAITEQLLSSGVLASSGSMNHLASGVLAEALRSGAQDTILTRLRETYAGRCGALISALRQALPPTASVFTEPQGGFFTWLVLPPGVRAEAVLALTTAHEECPVSALPGNEFSPSQSCGSCLRMAFTFYSEERLAAAGAVIGQAVSKLAAKSSESKSD